MRAMGLAAMTAGAFYLWIHFKSLLLFLRPRISKGPAWALGAVLAAALLAAAAAFNSVLTGFYLYLCMCYLLTDCAWLVVLLTGKNNRPWRMWRRAYAGGLFTVALAAIISVGGYFNAHSISVTQYEVRAMKNGLPEQGLRIAMLSDVHLGTALRGEDMPDLVGRINDLAPDMVLLCGDIYEERTTQQDIELCIAAFRELNAAHGVYYVPGNHEYYSARRGLIDLDALYAALGGAGITVLGDRALPIGDSVLLVGRDDATASSREPLAQLLHGQDMNRAIVVMDHQPRDIEEAVLNEVDLQLSGHTHAGQLFPAGILAQLSGIFPVVYGQRTYGDFQVIVSSGAGVWGFPMRVGSPCEIVLVTLKGV